ncbi:MAG TPA: universal stress protein [Mycobacterium sp.]|nr:universal stress protein [Mycobacterium sp.]
MPSEHLGIVVGVSGSAASRVALNWAARTARDRDLPVTAVVAVPAQAAPITNRLMVFGVRELPHRWVERILADTVDIVAASTGRGDPPKLGVQVVAGDPLDTLAELSDDAELIVVGARRRSAWRAVRSSLGAKLAFRSHCPVAIVRDDDPGMPHPAHAPVRVMMTGWSRP